jgi:restriction endonuclease S subunit
LIRTNNKLYSKYLHQYLQTSTSQSEILAFQTGSALKQLPRARLNDLTIKFPRNKIEQEKNGDFFSSLDSQIENVKSYSNEVDSLKKGYMQRLFA